VSHVQRIVFDTSTLVGAALRIGSTPHQALLKALACAELCASAESLDELGSVLNRRKFDRYLNTGERQEFIATINRIAHMVVVQSAGAMEIEPPCRDPSDNQFLALALAAESDERPARAPWLGHS